MKNRSLGRKQFIQRNQKMWFPHRVSGRRSETLSTHCPVEIPSRHCLVMSMFQNNLQLMINLRLQSKTGDDIKCVVKKARLSWRAKCRKCLVIFVLLNATTCLILSQMLVLRLIEDRGALNDWSYSARKIDADMNCQETMRRIEYENEPLRWYISRTITPNFHHQFLALFLVFRCRSLSTRLNQVELEMNEIAQHISCINCENEQYLFTAEVLPCSKTQQRNVLTSLLVYTYWRWNGTH